MSNTVITERVAGSLVVRFNRPEIRNPLSVEVIDEMSRLLRWVDADRVVFTGCGDVFASGANLNEIAAVTADGAVEFARRGQGLMQQISDLPMVTIAAINGFCFGGALDLTLACDHRVAAPNAEFCHPGVGLGIITGWGGTQRLPRLIGEAYALEMFLTARRVSAEEAWRFGLIDQISDDPVGVSLAKGEFAPASRL